MVLRIRRIIQNTTITNNFIMKKLFTAAIAICLLQPLTGFSQEKKESKAASKEKKAVLNQGLFSVEKNGKSYFFEIPDSIIGRLFLSVTRYTATPAEAGVYAGEQSGQQTLYWEKGANDKLFLRSNILYNKADSLESIDKAVTLSNEDPIIAGFEIKKHENGRYRIDVTSFLLDDNSFSVPSYLKEAYQLRNQNGELSYIDTIKTYPINTEIRLVRTYNTGSRGTLAGNATGCVTFGMNTSFVLLPEEPMRARLFDQRIGYFTDDYNVFSDDQQAVSRKTFVTRWRLEPKDEDIEKMKKGELVEPKKPIVFYIDPATPKKWRSYLIKGVEDWRVAFEQAGFKNAIYGKEWPENDSTMSMEDARYSVIRYLASDIPNAYGPQVHDPRSGEIIESHIGWYHNVISLVHDWYMIQAGAIDKRARKMNFDDELMGELIRFVSSHEVGHTLGLRHNFGSSSLTPVDSLRNKEWVEKHGHTASIMDYARFNYVAQPEDNIGTAGIYPRIGDYDKWAIEWGYRPTWETTDSESDRYEMDLVTKERMSKNKRLWWGDGEVYARHDPRCQTEDLGDNSMKASDYGIKNLKRILPNLPNWTYYGSDIDSKNLHKIYNAAADQFIRYIGHVCGNIGGTFRNFKTIDEKGDIYKEESLSQQREALEWIDKNVFTEPTWLSNQAYTSRFTANKQFITDRIGNYTINVLTDKISRMPSTYPSALFLSDITSKLFKETKSLNKLTPYRRNLQQTLLTQLVNKYKNISSASETKVALLSTLKNIKSIVRKAASSTANSDDRMHYQMLNEYIEKCLGFNSAQDNVSYMF